MFTDTSLFQIRKQKRINIAKILIINAVGEFAIITLNNRIQFVICMQQNDPINRCSKPSEQHCNSIYGSTDAEVLFLTSNVD